MNFPRALTAGLIGGVLVDLFLIFTRSVPFPGVYQFIASVLVGPSAFTSSSYIALGVAMHFTISIVFALCYAAVAERVHALIEQPLLWGFVFGAAVMVVMQIVLAIAHAAPPPSLAGILLGLVSHVLFFGIPVAFYISRGGIRRSLTAHHA